MNPDLLARLERLAAANIDLLPADGVANHFVFTRDGVAVLVQRRDDGFGSIGSPGRITGRGFEPLVDAGDGPRFLFKGQETPASDAEASATRSLLADVKSALGQ